MDNTYVVNSGYLRQLKAIVEKTPVVSAVSEHSNANEACYRLHMERRNELNRQINLCESGLGFFACLSGEGRQEHLQYLQNICKSHEYKAKFFGRLCGNVIL